MKVAKIKEKKELNREVKTEGYSLKAMIKILFWMILILIVFYFITVILINNKSQGELNNGTQAVIDSSKITISQLLNRKEKEYFVIATKASLYGTEYISLYNNYINKYKQKEDSISFYYINLDDALNKNYLSDTLNITSDINELQLNDEMLFKIKDGIIEKYYVGREEILDKLSRL